jgi:osmotically-inducible protein OsmY
MSDESLCQDVSDRLGGAGIDVADVEIIVFEGRVTLAGSVPDHRTRRLVEWICAAAPGVRLVASQLTLRDAEADDRELGVN